jgi:uncharacterized protein YndB with AHSA1/START domain
MTIRIHEIYIKATPEQIWEAITSPEWTAKYGYRVPAHYDLKPGGRFTHSANERMLQFGMPETVIDGEVLEANPPHRLVQTYRWLFTEQNKAEGYTRLTYEITLTQAGFCRLTITHDQSNAPGMANATNQPFNERGGGGWNWILSDLKTLLETGHTMSTHA